ncbi:MAG: hypothetical protein NTV75_06820 [Bacteroidia bacterium]|nr:hypothetical protein [Bacteroidia bacterium]
MSTNFNLLAQVRMRDCLLDCLNIKVLMIFVLMIGSFILKGQSNGIENFTSKSNLTGVTPPSQDPRISVQLVYSKEYHLYSMVTFGVNMANNTEDTLWVHLEATIKYKSGVSKTLIAGGDYRSNQGVLLCPKSYKNPMLFKNSVVSGNDRGPNFCEIQFSSECDEKKTKAIEDVVSTSYRIISIEKMKGVAPIVEKPTPVGLPKETNLIKFPDSNQTDSVTPSKSSSQTQEKSASAVAQSISAASTASASLPQTESATVQANRLVSQGNELARSGDIQAAKAKYTEAVSIDSQNSVARTNLENAQHAIDQNAASRQQVQQQIESTKHGIASDQAAVNAMTSAGAQIASNGGSVALAYFQTSGIKMPNNLVATPTNFVGASFGMKEEWELNFAFGKSSETTSGGILTWDFLSMWPKRFQAHRNEGNLLIIAPSMGYVWEKGKYDSGDKHLSGADYSAVQVGLVMNVRFGLLVLKGGCMYNALYLSEAFKPDADTVPFLGIGLGF